MLRKFVHRTHPHPQHFSQSSSSSLKFCCVNRSFSTNSVSDNKYVRESDYSDSNIHNKKKREEAKKDDMMNNTINNKKPSFASANSYADQPFGGRKYEDIYENTNLRQKMMNNNNNNNKDDIASTTSTTSNDDLASVSSSRAAPPQTTQQQNTTTVGGYQDDTTKNINNKMMDPNTAYLNRFGRQGVENGKISPEAAAYMHQLYSKLGNHATPVIEKMKDTIGDQDPKHLTPHQRNTYGSILMAEGFSRFSQSQRDMFNEHKGMKDFAENGTPTGENYWFEAGGSLTSHELPREMKDDLFDEMKRNRPEGSSATKDTGF